jgi:3-phenylpropionate/cinnamic acid dioxygenase small subunit
MKESNDGDLLRLLKDERAILRTMHRYAHTLDYGDHDGFVDCFTENAVYESSRTGVLAGGAAELRDFASRYNHAPKAYNKHVMVDPLIEVDGDSATARSYYLFIQNRESGPAITHYGSYEDRLARCPDGAWRITYRRLVNEAIAAGDVQPYRAR